MLYLRFLPKPIYYLFIRTFRSSATKLHIIIIKYTLFLSKWQYLCRISCVLSHQVMNFLRTLPSFTRPNHRMATYSINVRKPYPFYVHTHFKKSVSNPSLNSLPIFIFLPLFINPPYKHQYKSLSTDPQDPDFLRYPLPLRCQTDTYLHPSNDKALHFLFWVYIPVYVLSHSSQELP